MEKSPREGNRLGVLERNLNALRRTHRKLAEVLEQVRPGVRICSEPNSQGLPNLLLGLPQRRWYYTDNSSLEAAGSELHGLDAPMGKIAVFLGVGLGYQLVQFLRAHSSRLRTDRLIIIEKKPERLRLALQTTDLSSLLSDPRVSLLVGLDADHLFLNLFNLFRTGMFITRLSALVALYHPSDLAADGEYYVAALRQVREAAAEAAHVVGNAPHDSLIGLHNILANLRTIIDNPGISLLGGAFAGRPAVIVSTGPSLSKNIRQLRDVQDRSLILAVDASVAPLAAVGVKPHLVVSLERVPQVADLVRGFDLQDSYFAACPVVRPETYSAFDGPKLIVYRRLPEFEWLEYDKGTLHFGPSAANMAFKLAEYLGANPIILVGQDLAFGESGTTHAHHAILGENQVGYHRQRAFEVPGVFGGTVRTTEVWSRFLKHFRADILTFNGVCVDATEGGALIPGTVVMSLREAIERYMNAPFDARDMIRKRLSVFQRDPRVAEQLRERIEQSKTQLMELMDHCARGASRARRFSEQFGHLVEHGDSLTRKQRRAIEREARGIYRVREKVKKSHPKAYNLLAGSSLLPYVVSFEHRVVQLGARFSDRAQEQIAWGVMHIEWFTTVSEILHLCLRELENVALDDIGASR